MSSRLALGIALVLASAPLYATTYTFEPGHTQGVVRWNHLGFANPTAHFAMVEGSLDFDQAAVAKSSVTVTIPLSALSTGVPDLDDDFRSAGRSAPWRNCHTMIRIAGLTDTPACLLLPRCPICAGSGVSEVDDV